MQWTRREFEESKRSLLAPDCVPLVATRQLGRRVKSRRRARKSYRTRMDSGGGYVAVDVFIPPRGTACLSVDCLGAVCDEEMVKIAVGELTSSGDQFYGWYVLSVRDIYDNRCTLRLSPTPINKYHADIIFPVDLGPDDTGEATERIANRLASCAVFEPRGEWVDDVGEMAG